MRPSNVQTAVIIQRENIDGGSKPPVTIVGFLPEEFEFGVSSNYEQPFAEAMNDLISSAPVVGSRLSKTTRITSPFLTASYWQGSEVSDMSVTLVFEADSDPLEEVRKPILDLLSLVTPRYLDGLIVSPTDTLRISDEQLQKMMKMAAEATTTAVKTTASAAKNLASSDKEKDSEEDDSVLAGIIETGKEWVDKTTTFCKGLAKDAMDSITKAVGGDNNSKASSLKDPEKEYTGKDSKQDNAPNANNTVPSSKSVNEEDISPMSLMTKKLPSAISIKIGTYIEFPSIVITNVNTTFNSQIDAYTGWPMSATVQVAFRPLFSTCFGDVQKIFLSEPKPVVDKEMFERMQEPVNSQLTSSLTSGITSFVKDTAGSFTNSVTESIGNASKSVSSGISDLFKD